MHRIALLTLILAGSMAASGNAPLAQTQARTSSQALDQTQDHSDEDPLTGLRTLIEERNYEEAQILGRQLLSETEGDAARQAAILDQLVEALRRDGESSQLETQEFARRAIKLKDSVYGSPHLETANSISRYALVLAAAGDLESARIEDERALTMREAVLEPDDLAIASSLNNLANTLRRLGRYDEAAPLLARALEIREANHGPVHPEVTKVLQNMGNNLLRGARYEEARVAYERALAIKEETLGPDDPSLAYTLISMGVLYRSTGDYAASRAAYERALSITTASLGEEHPLTLAANNNLANLLNESGDFAAALPLYERTLAARVKKLGPEHPQVAETNHNLGIVCMRIGDYDRAAEHFAAAYTIWVESLGPEHPDVANNLESRANIEVLRQDLDAAIPLYERALAIRVAKLGPEHPETANSHLVLGAAFLEQGRRPEALAQTKRAAEILDRHLVETVAYMPERQSMAMVAAQRKPESVLFMGLLSSGEDRDAWSIACWDWTLRRRGLVQEELARRHRSGLNSGTFEARDAWEELARARAHLGEVWAAGPGAGGGPEDDAESFHAALLEAREEKELAEAELARLSVEYRQRHQLASLSAAELQAELPPASALVEIVRVELAPPTQMEKPSEDIALILDATNAAQFVALGPSTALDRLTEQWRIALHDGAADATQIWGMPESTTPLYEAGRVLRDSMWDPIVGALAGVETIFFVPDGAYHLVDLAALPGTNGGFLIEENPRVQLLDTGRDLARFVGGSPGGSAPRDEINVGVLALGDVDFDARASIQLAGAGGVQLADAGAAPTTEVFRGSTTSCLALAEQEWSPLPESRVEVEGLSELLAGQQDVLTLTGSEASEASFKREAPGRRMLHLATHAFFLQGVCAEETMEESPLLLSGLVLAGANQHAQVAPGTTEPGTTESPRETTAADLEDGILSAEEIAAMDLRGVELAVLSACDTGRGTVAIGEGVFGLRRAFQLAGTSTVVMSLWPVPDDATRAWMDHFYTGIAAGSSVSSAAREAGLRRLEELREQGASLHPSQWSGFVVVGDWN